MKRIDLIFNAIQKGNYTDGVNASELATLLQLDRANVSSDLNKLVKDKRLLKTNTRPVRFYIETNALLETHSKEITSLDTFAVENTSLKIAIEKAKASILYPPNGMHTLLLGETGVGKSMFASLMHEYAIEVEQLPKNAPFIVFNCADYANNPQLLLGQLFGIKKGAYTGASDQKGLIEKAHEGILFLDEVHRLPPEGQEMLFTFIDRGVYRRLGETENERKAQVLIITATTEEPNSFLLKTFTRRIPMTVTLPPLRERTHKERFTLLQLFFTNEAIRLRKEIHVSPNAMRAFVFYNCPNNIGQLKTDVQIACAKAYSDFVTKKRDSVYVSSTDLPWYMKEGLFIERKSRHLYQIPNETFIFTGDEGWSNHKAENEKQSSIYDYIDYKYEELQARGIEEEELELLIENDIQSFFVQYFNQMSKKTSHENVFKIVDRNIVSVCEKIAELAEKHLSKTFDEKVFLALSLHVQTTLQRLQAGKQIHHPQLNQIRTKYKEAFSVAMQCIQLLEDELQITMPIDEAGFLTMFFVVDPIPASQTEVKVLILAHGNGIATEMANVANELLGIDEVTGIDMPLHESPKDFLERVKVYMKTLQNVNGLLLLVDMGSLAYIGDILETEFKIPVRVLSMTSTPHALEAARKAQLGYSLDALYETVKNLTPFYLNVQEEKKKPLSPMKSVILTACLTGEGSALAIQKMLENYLRFDKDLIEIIPISIVHEKDLTKMIENIKKERNIICIVTNFDVQVPCLTYHFQDIVNYTAIQPIQELITYEETYAKMADILEQQMQRNDGALLIKTIRYALNTIQELISLQLTPDSLMGVILHMSCMVDRLQKGESLLPHPDKEKRRQDEYWMYMKVKKALQPIENTFEIQIPDDEVFYVMDFFIKNQPVKN
ncbi:MULTISPECIES: PRD domain-containing protein [Bacillus cereus group]|uniref:PRD domain-containing protein n=1 Tax=Bacillus cereus group TaxID=86661 RepID=UPI0022DEEBE1|nr:MULTISPECIES: sigma-54-dependent transcriptional regulator [unclassified Bacillus cereus group]MDA1645794.1 sigma 54-interacting transcriptional regulator [Bacillus cereus group sp. TH163-1LC]MDA1794936.1 sigma 54-interacting transcriptional regulator [Bacillus cereus group sp. BY8-1LC]